MLTGIRLIRFGSCALAACLWPAVVHAQNAAVKDADLRANLAWQIALERLAFSPGLLDGSIGRKTVLATREFQRVRGLPITGRLDPATGSALSVDPGGALTTYTVRAADLARVGPVPNNWVAKSKLKHLAYESLEAALAETFHCSRGLLRRLNPGRDLERLQPGDTIHVPATAAVTAPPRADHIEVDLTEKLIRVLSRERQLLALFHCSIAKHREKRPRGEASVAVITENPAYTFDPRMWPEVKNVDRKLLIPSGPRNPVGLCWIGLTLPGYGIHGSSAPEMIGKTGSHGCFRLTNWDALRLAKMVRVGTRVRFVDRGTVAAGATLASAP